MDLGCNSKRGGGGGRGGTVRLDGGGKGGGRVPGEVPKTCKVLGSHQVDCSTAVSTYWFHLMVFSKQHTHTLTRAPRPKTVHKSNIWERYTSPDGNGAKFANVS